MTPTKDTSDRVEKTFEGLSMHGICALLDAIASSTLRTKAQVRQVFRERATGFEETTAFLREIRVLTEEGHRYRLAKESAEREPHGWVVRQLFEQETQCRTEIYVYLSRFQVVQGKVVYQLHIQRASAESAVRNFLIELGVVGYDRETDVYSIMPGHIGRYAEALSARREVAPSAVKAAIARREDIGSGAEEVILNFERERVGNRLAPSVDHIARRNAAAGYDIVSWTVDHGEPIPRYIEVKAVSARSLGFYWTGNEMDAAQGLRDLYYLYLLPVHEGNRFEIDGLQVVRDPWCAVLGATSEWVVEHEVVHCSLASGVGGHVKDAQRRK